MFGEKEKTMMEQVKH